MGPPCFGGGVCAGTTDREGGHAKIGVCDMFESLTDKLTGVLDRLTNRGRLSEKDVDAALREVRLALLGALT